MGGARPVGYLTLSFAWFMRGSQTRFFCSRESPGSGAAAGVTVDLDVDLFRD